MNDKEFTAVRHEMVSKQIAGRGLTDPRLLSAFEKVLRHKFVPPEDIQYAYADNAIPIGLGQTISQPYIVALMTHLLNLKGTERVLEVGTGSGYQAAILACIAQQVHTIEYVQELADQARVRLAEYENVHCHTGDGSTGWLEAAPYDGILVAAAAPRVPQALLNQLNDNRYLVLPVGGEGYQVLEVWRRNGSQFDCQTEIGVAFVPLRGKHGWK
jgi:protein-L-isoaspartate(D-aspartate) O-methyltransferase